MKHRLLLNLLLLFSINSFCQDYIPLLDNTSWNVRSASWGGFNYIWINEPEDATVDGVDYKKYTGVPQSGGDVYVREDVEERKVYRLKDGAEQLLFDFTLEVGDLITLADNKEYEVTNKDSVTVMTGRKRVRIRLLNWVTPDFAGNSETWIEGVGNPSVPLVPFFEQLSDPAYNVYCSYNNGDPAYNFGLATNGTAIECPEPTASATAFSAKTVEIYPNPMQDTAYITSKLPFENATLMLRNILGQQVYQAAGINGNTFVLERSGLVAGVYFIEMKQEGRTIVSRKIIIAE